MTATIERAEPQMARKTPISSLSLPTAVRDSANDLAIDQTVRTRRKVSMAAVITAAIELARREPDRFAEVLDNLEATQNGEDSE